MSLAKLTLRGIEQWCNQRDMSIFEDIELPEGIDKDILLDTIFERSGEFEVLYPDPEYLTPATTHFFERHAGTIARWLEAAEAEYNPIDNYDRHEEYEGSDSGSGNGTAGNTTTDKRAAYNSSTFENYEQNTSNGNSTSSYNSSNSHEIHTYGNIGITTSVAMLREHVEFWKYFNLYTAIAELYISEFCLMVY